MLPDDVELPDFTEQEEAFWIFLQSRYHVRDHRLDKEYQFIADELRDAECKFRNTGGALIRELMTQRGKCIDRLARTAMEGEDPLERARIFYHAAKVFRKVDERVGYITMGPGRLLAKAYAGLSRCLEQAGMQQEAAHAHERAIEVYRLIIGSEDMPVEKIEPLLMMDSVKI